MVWKGEHPFFGEICGEGEGGGVEGVRNLCQKEAKENEGD